MSNKRQMVTICSFSTFLTENSSLYCLFQEHNAFLIPSHDFRLIAMFLIACTTLLEQFKQVIFIEFD